MPRLNLIFTTTTLLAFQTLAFGQIQFSGFADILFVQALEAASISEFQVGQFELDITAKLRPGISFEGAFALNPETGTFEVGAGFIEITFQAENVHHAARGEYFNHTGFSIGQFDVPFGIDWMHIASPDRRLATAPLINEKSINSWNDVGLNFHTDIGKANVVAFLVNGASDGYSIGGRAAYTPLDAIEMGVSYFTQTETNALGSKPQVIGVDFQSVTGPLATRAEMHYSEDLLYGDFSAIDAINTHHGFYLQTDLDLTDNLNLPLVLIGRYDDWSTINNSEESQRTTLGLAYTVTEGFEFRAEYLSDITNEEPVAQQFVIQTLVSF